MAARAYDEVLGLGNAQPAERRVSPVWLLAAGLIAVAVAALALVRPQVALLLLVVFDVANLNGVIADQVGVSPYRAQLALATVALLIVLVRFRSRLSWSPVLLGVAVLFAGFAVSLVGAANPPESVALLASRLRDLFYFVVVYALLLTTRAARPVAQAVVLVLAGLAALTVVHEFVLGQPRRPLRAEPGPPGLRERCGHPPARRHLLRRQLLGLGC